MVKWNPFAFLMALFQRLTPLEMAVLDAVALKLAPTDAIHFRAQVKAAGIARDAIGRVVIFSYPSTRPPVLSGKGSATLVWCHVSFLHKMMELWPHF